MRIGYEKELMVTYEYHTGLIHWHEQRLPKMIELISNGIHLKVYDYLPMQFCPISMGMHY